MNRIHRVAWVIAFVVGQFACFTPAAQASEQRLFWAQYSVSADVDQLVLHGSGRESWTTTWRSSAARAESLELWFPVVLGSEFELELGQPVRADRGAGEARFLGWGPASAEFARDLPAGLWGRPAPRERSGARPWSLPSGLLATALALAALALVGRRRGGAWASALALALAIFGAFRWEPRPLGEAWTSIELSGAPETVRGFVQHSAAEELDLEAAPEGPESPEVHLRTLPAGAAVQISSGGPSSWTLRSPGGRLLVSRPLEGLPMQGGGAPQPSVGLDWPGIGLGAAPGAGFGIGASWGPEMRWARRSASGTWSTARHGEPLVGAPAAASPGGLPALPEGALAPGEEGVEQAPGWLRAGLPAGQGVLLIWDWSERAALRWVGLEG